MTEFTATEWICPKCMKGHLSVSIKKSPCKMLLKCDACGTYFDGIVDLYTPGTMTQRRYSKAWWL